jgi:hypothetical protein
MSLVWAKRKGLRTVSVMMLLAAVSFVMLCSVTSLSAKPLETSGVRIVSESQRSTCKFLGLVSVRKSLGPNKLKGALTKAMKEVSKLGGNGLYVVAQQLDWAEGAQITGEALLCEQSLL